MDAIETIAKLYDYDFFTLKKHAIEQFLSMAPAMGVEAYQLTPGRLDVKFTKYFTEAYKSKEALQFSKPDSSPDRLKALTQDQMFQFWDCFIYFLDFASESGYQCAINKNLSYIC